MTTKGKQSDGVGDRAMFAWANGLMSASPRIRAPITMSMFVMHTEPGGMRRRPMSNVYRPRHPSRDHRCEQCDAPSTVLVAMPRHPVYRCDGHIPTLCGPLSRRQAVKVRVLRL